MTESQEIISSKISMPLNSSKMFIFLSILIHLGLIAGLQQSFPKTPPPKPKFFEVDFIKKTAPIPKKTQIKPAENPRPKRAAIQPSNKPPSPPLQKSKLNPSGEATISLNTSNIKYTAYLAHLKSRINHTWNYPETARKDHLEGELTLTFTIHKSGKVIDVVVNRSSGREILDTSAVQAIHAAGPFMPLPQKLNLTRLNVVSTFIYQYTDD